jgi:hypothetical protein
MEPAGDEIERLKRVLTLPAIWSGGQPSRIGRALLDVLPGMLRLDFAYLRLKDSSGATPIELIRLAQSPEPTAPPPETAEALGKLSGDDPRAWPASVRDPAGDGDISILPQQLGAQGEIGLLVAGSRRENFPEHTERLVLGVRGRSIGRSPDLAGGFEPCWFSPDLNVLDFASDRIHPCLSIAGSTGILRRRFPVAAKIALATAGTIAEVPASPMPPGGSRL